MSFSKLTLSLAFLFGIGSAHAHDLNPAKIPAKFMSFDVQRAAIFKKMQKAGASRGVFAMSSLWSPRYTKVKVCFMDGGKAMRQHVALVASQWNTAQSSLKLDFGKMSNPRRCDQQKPGDIRVTFAGNEYASLVGVVSATLYTDEASLILGGMEDLSQDELQSPDKIGTILHEFGHALGLQHEHQSEAMNCDAQFDWNKIYATLGGPPNFMDKDKVDHNMQTLRGDEFLSTFPDRESIMLYSFPAEYFKAGSFSPCYKLPNHSITPQDFQTLVEMYPVDLSTRTSRYFARRAFFQSALQSAVPPSMERSSLPKLDWMKILFPQE